MKGVARGAWEQRARGRTAWGTQGKPGGTTATGGDTATHPAAFPPAPGGTGPSPGGISPSPGGISPSTGGISPLWEGLAPLPAPRGPGLQRGLRGARRARPVPWAREKRRSSASGLFQMLFKSYDCAHKLRICSAEKPQKTMAVVVLWDSARKCSNSQWLALSNLFLLIKN